MAKKLILMLLVTTMDVLVCAHAAGVVTALILSPVDLIQAACRLL